MTAHQALWGRGPDTLGIVSPIFFDGALTKDEIQARQRKEKEEHTDQKKPETKAALDKMAELLKDGPMTRKDLTRELGITSAAFDRLVLVATENLPLYNDGAEWGLL